MCHAIILNEQLKQSVYPTLLNLFATDVSQPITQAVCLNRLRQANIDFLNLGNVVYCYQQQILLFFKQKQLYAYKVGV